MQSQYRGKIIMPEEFKENIIEKLQARGAGKSSVWLTKSTVHELNVERNELSLFRTVVNCNLKMKIIKDQRMAATSVNDLSEESIHDSISALFESMEASLSDPSHDIASSDGGAKMFCHNLNDPVQEQMVTKLNDLVQTIRQSYPKVIIGESHLAFHHEEAGICNSSGVNLSAENNYFVLFLMFTAKEGKKSSSFNYAMQWYRSLNEVNDLPANETLNRLLAQISEQINTHTVEEKFTGDIIITPECLNEILWMLLKPVFEQPVISGTSIYLKKLNQTVASNLLTLKAMPLSDEFAVKSFISQDGFVTENETIIDKGILKTFILSLYGSNKSGFARSLSEGGMMVIEPGATLYADMVKKCKKGVLLCRFSAGIPNESGDFSGVAKNSYYIENGEVKYPLAETMISGNTAEMLNNITEISRESVNNGLAQMPWMTIRGLTVSGGKIS